MTDDRTPQPAVRANRSERTRRKRRAPLLLVVPVLLAIAAVALFVVLRGQDSGGLPFLGGGGDDEVPTFEFKVKSAKVVATREDADLDALIAAATGVGEQITPVLDDLFTAAFLDPGNWRDGDYAEVFEAFDEGARASAEQSVETLTLGTGAGDLYETVSPTKGSLEFRVLFDQDGAPDMAVVKFRFYALAEGKDGTFTAIVSHGQLFMRDVGGWRITAFTVKRNDREAEPPTPGPSGSASVSPSA